MARLSAADVLSSTATAVLLIAVVTVPLIAFTWLLGVSFASPDGFWLSVVVVPLLLLYVLKVRRPRRTVASVLFWRPISLEQRSQAPFKRLRRNLVLLLQLLALAALVYGLARPVILSDSREGSSLVVILDTSASMLARDVGDSTRFEAAQRRAIQLVRGLGPRDQATLIAVDRAAWTVVPWTHDEDALEEGVLGLSPRHASTDLADGLVLGASALRAAGGRPEVHLLSDGGGPKPAAVALGSGLRYHRFGSGSDNLGIVAIDARPRLVRAGGEGTESGEPPGSEDGLAYEVFARVLNASDELRHVFVSLERGKRVLAARKLSVPAGADRPVVLEARLPPGAVSVRLLPAVAGQAVDALEVDDVAHVLIPDERGVQVGLVSEQESPALERALVAAGGILRRINPKDFRDDPELRLYVFEGFVPKVLPPRDCLIVGPHTDVGPVTLGKPVAGVRSAGWDREDPLLRYIDFSGLEVAEARELGLGSGARVLLQGETPDGAGVVLLAAWRDGGATRVAAGFDLYRSTWPLRASFPIFVRSLVLAASERDRRARSGLPAGVPVSIPVGTDVSAVEITAPDGALETVNAWGGNAYFAGTRLAGVYSARSGDDRVERFCVNLTDPEETRIAVRESVAEGDGVTQERLKPKRPTEVGHWFAMAALVLLVVEYWVYHRRV